MHGLPDHAKGLVITLAGVVILSPDALLIRLVTTDNWTIIFFRGALTAGVLAGFLALRFRRDLAGVLGSVDRLAMLSGLCYGFGNICFVQSINRTLVANTLVILAATPLIAAVFSHLFLGERQRRATWGAIAVVLAGIGAVFAGSLGGGHLFGDLLAIGSATAMAGNLTALRRSRTESPLPSVIIGGGFAALVSLPLASPAAVSGADFAVLLVLGALVMPVSFGLIFLGPKYLPAPEVALLLLLEAILGPLLVWFALGEQPTPQVALGGAVIIATVGIHAALGMRRRDSLTP
jgi:drug/metabolite transporter (DMT)-like permease